MDTTATGVLRSVCEVMWYLHITHAHMPVEFNSSLDVLTIPNTVLLKSAVKSY